MSAVLETMLLNALWQLPLLAAAGLLAERVLRPFAPAVQYRLWLTITGLELLVPAASAVPDTWLRFAAGLFQRHPAVSNSDVTILTGPAIAITRSHLVAKLAHLSLALYLALTGYFALRLLWRSTRLSQLRRHASPVALTPALQTLWSTYERRFHTRATLVTSLGITSPITIGVRSKLLLLPEDMLHTLPPDEFEAILAHEFAHMQRNDFTSNLVVQILTLPIAFHPALWLTRAHLVQARELVCDRLAAAHTGRVPYTRSLLRLAARILAHPSTQTPNAIGVFDAHPLERRLMHLTNLPVHVSRTRRFALLAAILAVTSLTCGTAFALRVTIPAALPQDASNSQTGQAGQTAPIRVAAGVMSGQIESKVQPVYPPDAKVARIQGSVILHAIIGKDGKIQALSVISGPPELAPSAIDAVSKWVYKPFLLNGDPTEVETTITVNYSFGE